MKAFHLLFIYLFLMTNLTGQDNYWTTDIATIIYNNCASCHHDGGIAPFSLMSF